MSKDTFVHLDISDITFTTSIIRGGNFFFPEKIKLDFHNRKLIYYYNQGIKSLYLNSFETTINLKDISSVAINKYDLCASLTIKTNGNNVIVTSSSFSLSDAELIYQVLNEILDQVK